MSGRRNKRSNRPNPKPYGFCCFPTDDILPRHGLDTSLDSLTSLHECPALKIREQEIVKRPKTSRSRDGMKASRGSSAFKLSLQSPEAGGMMLDDATESMMELMIDMMRGQRQAEYEQRMDRWAALGEKKTKERKIKKLKCGPPCWYTDYSLSQLQHLKDLEDAMFKDKKENTTNRTAHCLAAIGMTTDFVKVDSQILRQLVNEYNADIKKFICEIYKAIRGNYFQDEGLRLDYTTHERIMISGVVFLELPQVILELHRRLPAIIKFKFPPKPKPPQLKIPRKMISPLLEKLYPPVNWKLHATRVLKWRKKCLSIPRPVAILPKETKEVTDSDMEIIDQKKMSDNIEERKNQIEAKQEKSVATAMDIEKNISRSDVTENSDQDKETKIDAQQVSAIAEGHHQDTSLFTIENPWTEPATPCPMKYIKLLRETGPMKTDSEFFSQLNREPCKNQVSPSFRLQSVLIEAEADMHGLMHEANQLTTEITRIAKEILEPDTGCDACCSCRETRRAHLMWHATKAPHAVVDGVVADDDNKTRVIGATAMHSPAESISSVNQPPIVPSTEKFVKNKIITGTTTMVDGEPVNQIAGVTKTLEHVPHEVLRPDVEIVEVKNVPPCGCRDDKKDEELEMKILSTTKDEGLCYGKKFRPDEGPTYTCSEFGKKGETDDCGCEDDAEKCEEPEEYSDEREEYVEEDDCGCGDDIEKCADKDITVKSLKEKEKRVTCKRCGRQLDSKCLDANARKLHQSKTTGKGKNVTNKCSCDSLSEFLQMDLRRTKCVMPKKDYYAKEVSKDVPRRKSKKASKVARKSEKKVPKERPSRVIVEKTDRSKKLSQAPVEEISKETIEISQHENLDEGGPYGYRTKSEEALPVERTLAYLSDRHPPNHPAERIPVREGGRPCRCRENRNNRKTLLYGINAVVNENGGNDTRVIEGITWLTPEPSIRGSDEYIPEYELADSPYEKQICGATRRGNKERREPNSGEDGKLGKEGIVDESETDRMGDWESAFKDEYLTEFFTKKRDSVPCWTKCSKFYKKDTRPRKLKVMKPVCECKYERRIVKRNEERKRWHDRQQRLKSLGKEAFLHVDDIAKPELSDSEENREVTIISAIAMQTPYDTPQEGRSRSHLPYVPQTKEEAENINELGVEGNQPEESKKPSVDETERPSIEVKKLEVGKQARKPSDDVQKQVNLNETREIAEIEDELSEIEFTGKMSRRMSFFDQAEEELTEMMRVELEKMAVEEDLVSLKLPNYHHLAQLSYWISYRVRGMCFTDKYKKELMHKTMKCWNSKRLTNKSSVESLRVRKRDRCKLNFDHAKYWKRKIRKLTNKFYEKTRQEVVEIGRQMWPTMEFGKFPHLLFKQAYFTYLPPREVDIYAFRTYLLK